MDAAGPPDPNGFTAEGQALPPPGVVRRRFVFLLPQSQLQLLPGPGLAGNGPAMIGGTDTSGGTAAGPYDPTTTALLNFAANGGNGAPSGDQSDSGATPPNLPPPSAAAPPRPLVPAGPPDQWIRQVP